MILVARHQTVGWPREMQTEVRDWPEYRRAITVGLESDHANVRIAAFALANYLAAHEGTAKAGRITFAN